MQSGIYPLTFEPVFRDYLWGGRHLETLYGRHLPPGIVAESWDISGHPSSPSPVANGSWRGHTLPEVLATLGETLVGRNARATLSSGRFPLLVKLLDANQDLSVQVHPDDAYAAAHEGGDPGKTEMWYVLHAQPGAQIVYGLAAGATRASFTTALGAGTLATQLHRLQVRAGDCIPVPSGTLHALLAGAVVAEIQQNSDTTYRVYDWDRLGADGRPRPLHIDKAVEVINWAQVAPGMPEPHTLVDDGGLRRDLLVRFPQFTVERVGLASQGSYRGACDGATFEIWGCVAGTARLEWEGEPLALPAVSWTLLPAALGAFSLKPLGNATLLRAYVEG